MKLRTSIKVLGAVGLAQLIIFGCSSSGDDAAEQSSAATGGKNISIVDYDEDGVPTFIVGDLGAAPSARSLAPAALQTPLTAVSPIFHAQSANLVFVNAQHDAIGDTHYRYRQRRDGKDVIGAEILLHVRNGSVYAANGTVREDLAPSATKPTVSAADAVAAAVSASQRLTNVAAHPSPDLAYLQQKGTLSLVYRVDVTGVKADKTPVHDTVLVDATDGTVTGRIPHVHTAENREVHNAANGSSLPGAVARTEGGAASSDTTVNGNYDNLGVTWTCYKQLFNRDSFDNAGAKFISSVHYSVNYNNAFWDGTQMVYGDGDGQVLTNLAVAQDVTAHELTHAVTERTSGLIYSGESGGLNESMSDIFGNTCEWFGKGKPATPPEATWEVGEEVYTPNTPGDALRYMDNPTKDGASLDWYPDYNGSQDVHYSSGISNLAFYLLSHGGTHPTGKSTVQVNGIGIDKASQIFYRANTTIFTSSETFAQARTGCEQAATQLGYGSDIVASVSAAWAAVGVGKISPPQDGGTDSGAKDGGGKDSGGDSGSDGGTSCAHDKCSSGIKLASSCDPCVGKVCAQDSYCCTTGWDSICVGEVKSICGITCGGGGGCAHPICTTGGKLSSSCDPCATKICAADSYCCNTAWDSICVGEVSSVCKQTCN